MIRITRIYNYKINDTLVVVVADVSRADGLRAKTKYRPFIYFTISE